MHRPNTDGFNVAGMDMHISDSSVCNNDDCVPVNAPTKGLLVERVNCICQWGQCDVLSLSFK